MTPTPKQSDGEGRPGCRRGALAAAMLVGVSAVAAVVWAEPPTESREVRRADAGRPRAEVGVAPERPSPNAGGVDRIRFSHSTHADVSCQQCHGESGAIGAPGMETCSECHGPAGSERPEGRADPALRDCGGCHVGYDRAADGPVAEPEDWRAVEPPPMVRPPDSPSTSERDFDHGVHLRALDSNASGEGADAGDAGAGSDAAACRTCHDGRSPEDATKPCGECHSEPSRKGRLKPANHTVDWIERHGTVARSQSRSCEDCHTEDDCSSCHDEQVAQPYTVHPPNFDTLHAADARSDGENCTECHNVETFCRRCHAETNVSAAPTDRPPARFDAHPPSWTDPDAPNNHAVQARRNITECASCHTERDCVTCHRGVNPHPPEFRLRCRSQLQANPAPCAKCHGDVAGLRSKCL